MTYCKSYISLPYPHIPAWPEALQDDLRVCHEEHINLYSEYGPDARKTRHDTRTITEEIVKKWREPWLNSWLKSDDKREAILTWLADAIYLDYYEDITHTDALNVFLSIHVLVNYGKMDLALYELAAWQRYVALNFSNRQRNIALDVINQVEDELYEIPQDQDNKSEDPQEPSGSASGSASGSSSNTSRARKVPKEGNQEKCARWCKVLRENLLETSRDNEPFSEVQRLVARTIQQMKRLPESIYKTSVFVDAVARSKLALTIVELAHPAYGYLYSGEKTHDPRREHLLRLHGFGLVLGDLLDKWTPQAWTEEAKLSLKEQPVSKYNRQNRKGMSKGSHLFQALKVHPYACPSVSNPTTIFFLCSLDNFTYAWNTWLSWALDAEGYKVCDTDVPYLYQDSIRYLQELKRNASNYAYAQQNWDGTLLYIIERTLVFRKLLDKVNSDAHDFDVKHCHKCAGLAESNHCVQRIEVTLNTDLEFVERWDGVGVTKVPKGERMKPRKGRKASQSRKAMVHPDDVGLKRIAANDKVLERCGKQIYLFCEGNKLCDFVWYEAFSRGQDGVFERLVKYTQTALGVQPIHRGAKFAFWTSGQMVPFGPREPSGGRLADHYTCYAGIEAETLKGISTLFEQAEMSATILLTARSIHPEIVKKIKEESAACEKIGLTGLNLFNCNGYTAPQHFDTDCTPSLCAQFLLKAEQQWSEFGFVALQYGYYIESRENTLWSFDSSLLHGTMLPSERTVLRLRGGAAESVGSHTTTRERDQRRARRNQQTQHNYQLRARAWEGR